jgi:hypothetical protein
VMRSTAWMGCEGSVSEEVFRLNIAVS